MTQWLKQNEPPSKDEGFFPIMIRRSEGWLVVRVMTWLDDQWSITEGYAIEAGAQPEYVSDTSFPTEREAEDWGYDNRPARVHF